jgi:transposase
MAKRDTQKEREKRRLRAGRLLLKGTPQVEVARRLDVGKGAVSGWAKQVRESGLEALRSKAPLGRPAGMDDAQRAMLVQALKDGAIAQGYATELWTLPRVRSLIESLLGIRYSEPHVWRILRNLGFSPQRPSKRALERDERAIREWKRKRWPTLKKTPRDKVEPSFSSTSRD